MGSNAIKLSGYGLTFQIPLTFTVHAQRTAVDAGANKAAGKRAQFVAAMVVASDRTEPHATSRSISCYSQVDTQLRQIAEMHGRKNSAACVVFGHLSALCVLLDELGAKDLETQAEVLRILLGGK